VTLKPETSETKKRKDKTVLESRTFKEYPYGSGRLAEIVIPKIAF
jgi:hypothetical protein